MKKISVALAIVVTCYFALSAPVFGSEDSDRTLASARKLVEERSYAAALEDYSKISDELRKDPGLVIEWARVYTYADMHSEAIRLFEEVRTKYPERAQDILKELGDQYKWNKNLSKSIETYEEVLRKDPGNITAEIGLAEALAWNDKHVEAIKRYDDVLKKDPNFVQALIAKAEVLSWMDKLEESQRLYKRVLNIDPGNLKARLGEARVMVWGGYHRKAVAKYNAILRDHPDDAEAIEGLAYAYHWDGNEAKTLEVVKRVIAIAPAGKRPGIFL